MNHEGLEVKVNNFIKFVIVMCLLNLSQFGQNVSCFLIFFNMSACVRCQIMKKNFLSEVAFSNQRFSCSNS